MGKILTIDEIKASVAKVAPEYGVKRVTLFGSYAEGKQKPGSDIDLLVEFNKDRQIPVTLFTLGGMASEVEDLTGKEVDIIPFPIPRDSLIIIGKEVLLYGT